VCGILCGIRRLAAAVLIATDESVILAMRATNMLHGPLDKAYHICYVMFRTCEKDFMMTNKASVFWDDLARDLEDPEFLREYIVESMRIATIDYLVNSLDQAREASGMTKADLARAISVEPAVVRRLLGGGHQNPTIGTMAEVAAALGMRITVERLPAAERKAVTDPLVQGQSKNTQELAERLTTMRRPSKTAA